MKYSRLYNKKTKVEKFAIEIKGQWQMIKDEKITFLDLINLPANKIDSLQMELIEEFESYQQRISFQPTAYRDFMLYEKHAIDAARGFVKKYMVYLLPVVMTYEKIFRRPFPKLKPKKRFYQHPIYYMGNHLNFISEGDSIKIPSYTKEMDYELELGVVICKPLKNASIDQVNDAIGGFLILNDFSARDIQLDEMDSGFGPMKTKNFGSSISSVIVRKESLIHQVDNLKVKVIINGKTIVESNTKDKTYSLQEAIAYASWEEQLYPGELFGSGTIPGCTGIENGVMLNKGDTITLEIEGIGSLTNKID
ncbi:fumarylacetoacetate hydrolase family protein [Maribacter sp. IgM3_T14_3]|uniref:fumarylacetoacetate hydrolase family protein n=1 Tax=Maribacter sp. IgM3_T14_3 TaxID=3415140 RepID=UPI003C6FA771